MTVMETGDTVAIAGAGMTGMEAPLRHSVSFVRSTSKKGLWKGFWGLRGGRDYGWRCSSRQVTLWNVTKTALDNEDEIGISPVD
jgi:hypothetical protein